MPKPPQLKAKQVLKALQKLGFHVARQKGSHAQLKKGNLLATVPVHAGDLNPETLKSILRQAKVALDELLDAI